MVHLALKLNTQGAASFEPAAAVWCALCGRWPRQVKHLLKGEHGYVCDLCFQQMRDIMEGNEKYRVTSPGDPAVDGFMVSCICCGEKPPRVFLPYSALCVNCVERAREELAGRPEK